MLADGVPDVKQSNYSPDSMSGQAGLAGVVVVRWVGSRVDQRCAWPFVCPLDACDRKVRHDSSFCSSYRITLRCISSCGVLAVHTCCMYHMVRQGGRAFHYRKSLCLPAHHLTRRWVTPTKSASCVRYPACLVAVDERLSRVLVCLSETRSCSKVRDVLKLDGLVHQL